MDYFGIHHFKRKEKNLDKGGILLWRLHIIIHWQRDNAHLMIEQINSYLGWLTMCIKWMIVCGIYLSEIKRLENSIKCFKNALQKLQKNPFNKKRRKWGLKKLVTQETKDRFIERTHREKEWERLHKNLLR